MRVIFINPGNIPALNIGLTYVMSAVGKNHNIELLDFGLHRRINPYKIRGLLDKHPRVVAFSASSFNFQEAVKVAKAIKDYSKDIIIIFGGIHPTLFPEETINFEEIDAICIGEGEKSFREYLAALEEKRDPLIDGIWFKDKKGNIIKNRLRPFEQDIDSFTFPDWDYWDIAQYIEQSETGMLVHLTSRGCPYSCTFCSNRALRKAVPGNFFRIRKPENIIEEIKINLSKYGKLGFKFINFDDEIFGLNRGFLENFCRLYIKEGLHKQIAWSCQTRADLLTEDYIALIAEAGCAIVGLGIETGDDFIREKLYKKNISNRTIINATTGLNKRNISYVINIIYGPYTDRAEQKTSIEFIKSLRPLRVNFSPLLFLPKTEINNFNFIKATLGERKANTARYNYPSMIYNRFLTIFFHLYSIQILIKECLRIKKFRFIPSLIKFICINLIRRRNLLSFNLSMLIAKFEYFTLYNYAISKSKERIYNR